MNTGITALAAGRLAGVLLHAAVGIAFCDALHAQPAGRAIRLVVPFGPGGGQDILARSFNNELGAALGDPVVIEYKPGAGGAVGSTFVANAEPINELLGGRIDLVGVPMISGLQYVNDPRVRLIGITGRTRSAFMPNVPPIAESFPGFGYESWFGLLGPAGTPRAVIERVNTEMTRILQTPSMVERLAKLGLEPEAMRPDAFTKVLIADRDRLVEIIQAAGIAR